MSTFAKICLSGAANGLAIKIAATASPGTTVHTCPAGTTSEDEIWLWAYNSDTTAHLLTIEFGDTTAPDHNIAVMVPSQGGVQRVIPGLILQNSKVVTAFAATTNVVTLTGYVNRITN